MEPKGEVTMGNNIGDTCNNCGATILMPDYLTYGVCSNECYQKIKPIKPTDLQKWKLFLDEQGVEYGARENRINIYETKGIHIQDYETYDLSCDRVVILFDKNGKLIK
jgi:hypothetical protein